VTTLYLTCLAVGGVVLLAQLALTVLGLGDGGAHGDVGHDHAAGPPHDLVARGGALEGLHLFSVRSLAAGAAFFGLGGLGAARLGAPAPVAAAAALLAGAGASMATAAAMRALLRLEQDGTVRVRDAVGVAGTVYVPIPAAGGGPGKVLLALQGRTVECQAVTREARALPTGTPVVVVDVHDADVLDVVPTPTLDGVS